MTTPEDWTEPDTDTRRALLRNARTIAMIGASDNPERPSWQVAEYLLGTGQYELFFIAPRAEEIHGQRVYRSLAELPVVPDIVDVFRRSEDLPAVAEEVIASGARTMWVQLGLRNDDAARAAEAHGITVVQDRCMKIEHEILIAETRDPSDDGRQGR